MSKPLAAILSRKGFEDLQFRVVGVESPEPIALVAHRKEVGAIRKDELVRMAGSTPRGPCWMGLGLATATKVTRWLSRPGTLLWVTSDQAPSAVGETLTFQVHCRHKTPAG